MTDWIEHNGGPQPVADDDWLEVLFPGTASGWMARAGNRMALPWKGQRFKWRFINQHLIDAARLEGIRLGLEAATKAADAQAKGWQRHTLVAAQALYQHRNNLRNLNPETIAQEAQHD